MKLNKRLSVFHSFLKFLPIFIIFYSMNNLILFGFDNNSYTKTEYRNDYNFEKLFLQNSISYKDYDSIAGQLKLFLGFSALDPEMNYFSDFRTINTSNSLRELYKLKLKDMSEIK